MDNTHERDPRLDPKPGDIFKLPKYWRPLEIAEVTPQDILVWGNDGARRRKMALCSLSYFRNLSRMAEVIHAAE